MLKEIVNYYSDTEPTKEEIAELKERSSQENKVFFVEYYCIHKDQIITLEFNNGQMSSRGEGTVTLKRHCDYTPDISDEELKRLCWQLRDMTGEGLISCKAALQNNNYNLEASKQWLREKGLAKAN